MKINSKLYQIFLREYNILLVIIFFLALYAYVSIGEIGGFSEHVGFAFIDKGLVIMHHNIFNVIFKLTDSLFLLINAIFVFIVAMHSEKLKENNIVLKSVSFIGILLGILCVIGGLLLKSAPVKQEIVWYLHSVEEPTNWNGANVLIVFGLARVIIWFILFIFLYTYNSKIDKIFSIIKKDSEEVNFQNIIGSQWPEWLSDMDGLIYNKTSLSEIIKNNIISRKILERIVYFFESEKFGISPAQFFVNYDDDNRTGMLRFEFFILNKYFSNTKYYRQLFKDDGKLIESILK